MTGKSDQQESPVGGRLRLTLRQLEVFVATARAGSTRGAAQQVARSQSAASAALAELEAALGAPLFDRIGRRLALNDAGRALLPGTLTLLEQATALQALLAGGVAAPLRIAASLTIGEYLLPAHIARWRLTHPDSPVQMTVGNTAKVIRAVVDRDVDLGFVEGPQTHPDLLLRRWLEDELVIVAAPTHPLAARTATLRALAAAEWILREADSGTRQAADAWLLPRLGALRVAFELGSTEAIKRLAATGAGLACMSRHTVAGELAHGTLVALRTPLPRAKRPLAVVMRRDRPPGRATAEFLRHCLGE
ncbi:MAG: LysR family transcriptional regulator [Burkholderiaceae bacterium]|nr:LysR family transcriptional regulator [Rhodoferax sp.]MCP5283422.1 LysR family transcriptional regulator [Burkholderiaceae bacterium]